MKRPSRWSCASRCRAASGAARTGSLGGAAGAGNAFWSLACATRAAKGGSKTTRKRQTSASQRRAKNDSSGSAMAGRFWTTPGPLRQSLVALVEVEVVLDMEGHRGALRGELAVHGDVGASF